MKTMLKIYFTHPMVLFLISTFLFLSSMLVHFKLLQHHYLWFFLPILLAPFYEWFAHRFILHAKLPKKDGWYKNFMWRLHHGHHQNPQSIKLLFAPPLFVFFLFLQMYLMFALLCLSFAVALVPLAGSILYYLYYEWVHLGHHIPQYQHFTRYGKMMKSAHMRHHHINENYWWGITNHLADALFNTFKERNEVEKSDTTHNLSGQMH